MLEITYAASLFFKKNGLQTSEAAVATPAHCYKTALFAQWNHFVVYTHWWLESSSLVWDIGELCGSSFVWNLGFYRQFVGVLISEGKLVPRYSSRGLIQSRNISTTVGQNMEQQDWKDIAVATIRTGQQTVFSPHIRLCISVYSSLSRLVNLEPKLLGPDFEMLYVVPGLIESKESHIYLVIISIFSFNLESLPMPTVLKYDTAPPLFFINKDDDKNIG